MSPPAEAPSPGPAEAPVPAWLRGLPRAPEYRPTESEFADPIAFLSRVEREAAAYGICKVIPPYPRPSRRFVFAHLNRSLASSADATGANPTTSSGSSNPTSSRPDSAAVFTTRHQELGTPRRGRPTPQVLKQVWQSGEQYTLDQFEAKSRAFSKTHLAGLRDPSALEVESLFWKASADRPIYIEYANDVPGSGFAASAQRRRQKKRRRESAPVEEGEKGSGWKLSGSPWNLQAIARAPGSLTRFMPDDVPGVTSPMVYIGMLFSWFAWHVEDHELHSLNFLHTGAPKTWYAVPGDRAAELEEVIHVHGYGGNSDRLASLAVLGEKTTLMSPEILVACGLPCCRLVQYPGEFVVTFPRAYHIGFSHGFNCGEAANFATPQWLKFAKEAAVRRAVMNHLPMLSHQQLLYLLAVSFISRSPGVLSGIRTSRLRDRRKEERELFVKQEFLQDMISENKLLCSFLKKKSIDNVVLWEPDLLPSSTALHSCPSGSKAPEKKSEDGCRIESSHCSHKDNCSSDGPAFMTGTQTKCMSSNSKSSDATSASEEKPDAGPDDEDDLPFDLSIDSGSLTCVACGILGYPFMAILQPSRKALEGISPDHRRRYNLSCENENVSNVLPCCPDGSSGCSFVPNRTSSPAEQPYPDSLAEQANFDCQSVKSHKDDVCLMEKRLDAPLGQLGNSLHSCRSENTLHSCANGEKSENSIPTDSLGSVLETDRGDIDAQAVEGCDNTLNWNTSCTFARPRIFCLQHALEIEELLEGKGGVHALIICHSDYIKLKALAILIAEEIEFQFDCTDVPLVNASKSDLHLINISIDDEGHDEDGRDWTSQMGLNLKFCAKLRKERSGNEEQPPLSVWGLFSNPSPISVVPNLKWLCRKARTPYKVVGFVSSSSAMTAAEKIKPEAAKAKIGIYGNASDNVNGQQIFKQCGLLQPSRSQNSDDISNKLLWSEENDHDRQCLIDIPIALAEYPMMHQVCEGPVSVSTHNDSICSSDSEDSPQLTVLPVGATRDDECVRSTELSSSTTVSVQQYLDGSVSVEGSTNSVSSVEHLEPWTVTSGHRDEWLQAQQDQENSGLCNNPNRTEALTISEENCGGIVSANLENEDGCAKTSYCSDTVIRSNKAASDNPPQTNDLGAVPMKQKSSCDDMISSVDRQYSLTFGCLGSTDNPGATKSLPAAHDLMSDELKVDTSHSVVKAIELKSTNPTELHDKSPPRDVIVLDDVQATSMTANPGQDGKSVYPGSNSFDILLGALAEESKVEDAPGKDEVSKASLTLMTLASNDHSADEVTEGKIVAMEKTDTILGVIKDDKRVDRSLDFHSSDVLSRSIGNSNRKDIICYVRRKRKRKRESQSTTGISQSFGSFVRSPCESLRPRTRPNVVEALENNRSTVGVFAAKKGRRTKLGPFQCDIDSCDMTFETRAELNAHKRNICTDESCGKRFSSHKYLKRHQCVHSEVRPLKCPWDGCEMTFKWLWAQTEHIRVHTGERPYRCPAPDCEQTFRYVSDYTRHRKKFNHY
ncbi:hypothetical protein ACP70R_013453 [Stipagrostis hirtigluma subsp. patula]